MSMYFLRLRGICLIFNIIFGGVKVLANKSIPSDFYFMVSIDNQIPV